MRNPECITGKKKFWDRMSAEGKARKMALRTKEPFAAYQCKECSFWHIGHKVPRIVREQRG